MLIFLWNKMQTRSPTASLVLLFFLFSFHFKKLIFAVYLTLRIYFIYLYSSVFTKPSVMY